MMSLWDALRMNMMISYQELVRTFLICNDLRQCHEPHCFVHNSPGHEVGHVFSLEGYTPVLSAVIG